ncbi:uncharacterized protein [Periplaneta americana]|uniref:uncharacterized protein isoform X2 n=1 Tax=Periplaneta americana TaxID=6978 RepID=UPI0037E8CD1A
MEEESFGPSFEIPIFRNYKGDPYRFFIHDCPEKKKVAEIIERGFGTVESSSTGEHTLVLATPGFAAGEDEVFSIDYILAWRPDRYKILDIKDFRLNKISRYSNKFEPMDVLEGFLTWSQAEKYRLDRNGGIQEITSSLDNNHTKTKGTSHRRDKMSAFYKECKSKAPKNNNVQLPVENAQRSTLLQSPSITSENKGKSDGNNDMNNNDKDEEDSLQLSRQRKYTRVEQMNIVDCVVRHKAYTLVHGTDFWKMLEEQEVCKPRKWLSMKEQFFRTILPAITSFNLAETELSEFRSMNRNYYTEDEDKALLNFVARNKRYQEVGGVQLWKLMERKQAVPGRTWHSMKERYRKVLVNKLDRYLPPETVQKMMHSTATGSKLKNKKRRSSKLKEPLSKMCANECTCCFKSSTVSSSSYESAPPQTRIRTTKRKKLFSQKQSVVEVTPVSDERSQQLKVCPYFTDSVKRQKQNEDKEKDGNTATENSAAINATRNKPTSIQERLQQCEPSSPDAVMRAEYSEASCESDNSHCPQVSLSDSDYNSGILEQRSNGRQTEQGDKPSSDNGKLFSENSKKQCSDKQDTSSLSYITDRLKVVPNSNRSCVNLKDDQERSCRTDGSQHSSNGTSGKDRHIPEHELSYCSTRVEGTSERDVPRRSQYSSSATSAKGRHIPEHRLSHCSTQEEGTSKRDVPRGNQYKSSGTSAKGHHIPEHRLSHCSTQEEGTSKRDVLCGSQYSTNGTSAKGHHIPEHRLSHCSTQEEGTSKRDVLCGSQYKSSGTSAKGHHIPEHRLSHCSRQEEEGTSKRDVLCGSQYKSSGTSANGHHIPEHRLSHCSTQEEGTSKRDVLCGSQYKSSGTSAKGHHIPEHRLSHCSRQEEEGTSKRDVLCGSQYKSSGTSANGHHIPEHRLSHCSTQEEGSSKRDVLCGSQYRSSGTSANGHHIPEHRLSHCSTQEEGTSKRDVLCGSQYRSSGTSANGHHIPEHRLSHCSTQEEGTSKRDVLCGSQYSTNGTSAKGHHIPERRLSHCSTEEEGTSKRDVLCGSQYSTNGTSAKGHHIPERRLSHCSTEEEGTSKRDVLCGSQYSTNGTSAKGHHISEHRLSHCSTQEEGTSKRDVLCGSQYSTNGTSAKGHHIPEHRLSHCSRQEEGTSKRDVLCGSQYSTNGTSAKGHHIPEHRLSHCSRQEEGTSKRDVLCGSQYSSNGTSAIGHHIPEHRLSHCSTQEEGTSKRDVLCGSQYSTNGTSAKGHHIPEHRLSHCSRQEEEGTSKRDASCGSQYRTSGTSAKGRHIPERRLSHCSIQEEDSSESDLKYLMALMNEDLLQEVSDRDSELKHIAKNGFKDHSASCRTLTSTSWSSSVKTLPSTRTVTQSEYSAPDTKHSRIRCRMCAAERNMEPRSEEYVDRHHKQATQSRKMCHYISSTLN